MTTIGHLVASPSPGGIPRPRQRTSRPYRGPRASRFCSSSRFRRYAITEFQRVMQHARTNFDHRTSAKFRHVEQRQVSCRTLPTTANLQRDNHRLTLSTCRRSTNLAIISADVRLVDTRADNVRMCRCLFNTRCRLVSSAITFLTY